MNENMKDVLANCVPADVKDAEVYAIRTPDDLRTSEQLQAEGYTFAHFCPCCHKFIETSAPAILHRNFTPICEDCTELVTPLGLAGKTHADVIDDFREKCKSRKIVFEGGVPPIAAVLRTLAEWRCE